MQTKKMGLVVCFFLVALFDLKGEAVRISEIS
jgi:hypothetical protein